VAVQAAARVEIVAQALVFMAREIRHQLHHRKEIGVARQAAHILAVRAAVVVQAKLVNPPQGVVLLVKEVAMVARVQLHLMV
jgi:uncharacterized sodium:solute symporter family permease YidK